MANSNLEMARVNTTMAVRIEKLEEELADTLEETSRTKHNLSQICEFLGLGKDLKCKCVTCISEEIGRHVVKQTERGAELRAKYENKIERKQRYIDTLHDDIQQQALHAEELIQEYDVALAKEQAENVHLRKTLARLLTEKV